MKNRIRCQCISFLLAVVLFCSSLCLTSAKSVYASSNQDQVFTYLTSELGLNAAAACGIMANIAAESSFSPTALSSNGSYYGICQWGGSRKTALESYCSKNGYSASSLEGQLHFLAYELKNDYPSLYTKLLAADNSASGAYQAGYDWCYYYERPGNLESTSAKRGAVARDTYWPQYCDYETALPFVSHIETADGTAFTGKAYLQGWAIAAEEITLVTATVNGYVVNGGFMNRADVAAAYPDYTYADQGFYVEIMPKYLVEGENTAVLTAYTASGTAYEIGSVAFTCSDLDQTAPVISDVEITDVSETGYTVTCTVTDESGISRVQFPTWTVINGQDDLAGGWRTSEACSGTINGNTVTFRVDISDHNNETDDYITHIYAYDSYENVAVVTLTCTVPSGEITYGDVNNDGDVDAQDALMVLRYVVSLTELNASQQKAADVNASGAVETEDALLILQGTVDLREVFPAQFAE